jgi:photosystem II stability/assembly factor-like uncharacterized protein
MYNFKKITFDPRFLEVYHRQLLLITCLSVLFLRGQSDDVQLTFEKNYLIPGTSIRAIEVDEQSNLWFAGSNGKFGKIANGNLQVDSLTYGGKRPSFRSLALRNNEAFVLSIENPALLFKLSDPGTGKVPELIFKEEHPDVFYDSMTFLSHDVGIAMGDPIDGCLSILITSDGGETWKKKSCVELPAITPGEAGFAASDTNIASHRNLIWIGTGGAKARVFISRDKGASWGVFDTPIIQGGTMTGIYSLDFADELNGIAMGGNWEKKGDFANTKAVTEDGGKTWSLVSNGELPGYISCVRYIPETNGKELLACSTEGIYYSDDRGRNWIKLSDKGFYTLRFENRERLWMSKNNEISKVTLKRR